MKISLPKPPAASRPAEPPAKSGNTGIVPSGGKNTGSVPSGATKPSDSFQPTTATAGKGGTSAATGASATSLTGTSSTSTYALSPNLEQFRELFDKEGERIAKMPVQAQPGQIEATSNRLYEQLKDFGTLDEVTSGVKAAVEYFSNRRSSGNDPMTYALAADSASRSTSPEQGGSFGTSFNPGSGTRDTGSLPSTGRQQRTEEETHQRFRRMRRHF